MNHVDGLALSAGAGAIAVLSVVTVLNVPFLTGNDRTPDLQTDVPHWEPANRNPTDTWTCGDTPVLMYGAIQISYEEGWKEDAAQPKFEALARDYGGSVQLVLGRPPGFILPTMTVRTTA